MMGRYLVCGVLVLVCLAGLGCGIEGLLGAGGGTVENTISIVEKPSMASANDFYTGNRPPLAPSPFMKLPIGAIKPKGWVRRMLELEAEGFTGHLLEISGFLKK